jgi:hypothetical protein
MPDSLDNPKDKFFTHWEQYKKAKYADQKHDVFAYAINCRGELQKIVNSTDPIEEEDTFRKMFGGFMAEKEAAEEFRVLCKDSLSYPES